MKLLVMALLSMISMPTAPSAEPEQAPMARPATPDLTGYWDFDGDQDGTVYRGLAVIVRHGSGVGIRWINEAGTVSVGAGMWLEDGSLIAASGGGGVVRYRVSADGKSLDGKWIGASGKINQETLKFLKRRD